MKKIETKNYKIAKYEDFDKWEELKGDHKDYLIDNVFHQSRIDSENPDETFEGLNRRVERPERHERPERKEEEEEDHSIFASKNTQKVLEYVQKHDLVGLKMDKVLLELSQDLLNERKLMAQAATHLKNALEKFSEDPDVDFDIDVEVDARSLFVMVQDIGRIMDSMENEKNRD